MPSFSPPTDDVVPPLLPSTSGTARRLLRHFSSNPRGRNVYYLSDGTITETDPDGTTVTWDDVETVWWGGHAAVEVTAAEQTALEAAGYTVEE